MKRIFEFSVKQPLFVNLITLIIVFSGVMALLRLNKDIFPNINLDLVVIKTIYPGATPSEIEKRITIPIEKELKTVDDIKKIQSVSLEGSSMIVIEIEPDTDDKDKVVNDIQRATDRVDDLPSDLKNKPLVEDVQMKNHPIITLSISSDKLTEDEITKYAKSIETRLLDHPDIAGITRYGWRDREIWVEVDPSKAADYYLSLAQIISTLQKHNVNISGGSIINGSEEKLVRTTGEFENAEDIKKVILRANEKGNWVQVSDIAKVTERFERHDLITRTDGKQSVNLVVIKKERGDAIKIVKDVKEIASQFTNKIDGLGIAFVDDMSFYIKRRLNVLKSNGYLGIILVTSALFLFLSWRAAFVTTIGIPIAFLTAFSVMYWAGLTINLITMIGLIIVLGMIVDDAIVVSENVFRLREQGLSPKEAAVKGAMQVWKPVTTSVLTTIAAFAPLMFMSGIIGKFVLYIPLIIIVALLASLIEAFLILPAHLAEMDKIPSLKTSSRKQIGKNFFESKLQKLTEINVNIVRKFLKRRYVVFSSVIAIFIISLFIALKVIPFILFPARGIDAFFVRAKAPLGTPLIETSERMKTLEDKFIKAMPKGEMDNFVTIVGVQQNETNDPNGKKADHFAQINVYLKPHVDRKYEAAELVNIIKEKIGQLPEFEEITYDKINPGPPVGKAVEIHVKGEDFTMLEKLANDVKEFLKTINGVNEIRDGYEPGKNEIRMNVDENLASRAGLTIGDIGLAIRASIDGQLTTTIRKSDEEIDIRVLFPDTLRYDPDVLNKILIPNSFGKLIPLTSVAKFEEKPGILSINHMDRQRSITVTASVDEKHATSMSVMKKVQENFKTLSQDHPGFSISFGGEWENTMQSFRDFGFALVVACLIIFLLLAFEFQSIIQPIIVMFAIPYGLVGVILAFLVHNEPKSFLALFGVVGLSGVVVNSSIVLVDFINSERKNGVSIDEAILNAVRIRLRPIMLTTTTTFLGVIPVAYGIMGSDPFLKPMALALGWGLPFSALGTLLITPCFYRIVEDFRALIKKQPN